MIKKLHSAGLGFYVGETETQQKLGVLNAVFLNTSFWAIITGTVPLRELVYRVIALPPSMRPLVYDFGQLNTDTERDYTYQIVRDHVSVCIYSREKKSFQLRSVPFRLVSVLFRNAIDFM